MLRLPTVVVAKASLLTIRGFTFHLPLSGSPLQKILAYATRIVGDMLAKEAL